MTELLPIVFVALGFAGLAEYRSPKDRSDLLHPYRSKDGICCVCMMLAMAIFAGLRTRYNDTATYLLSYHLLDVDKSLFYGMNWSLGASDGFQIVTRLIKSWGWSSQTYLMVFALFDIGVDVWFVRKYSNSLWLSFFLYIVMGCYVFNMAALMQCTASALTLLAIDRFLEGKKVWFVIFVLLAMTFHTYAFMFILIPFLCFPTWTKKTYWMLGGFFLIGLLLPQLLGMVVSLTSAMGETYTLESFSGTGVNIFRFLVVSVLLVLSFLVRDRIQKEATKIDMLMLNLSMLNAEIMFVALFGTANYFARLANYFLIFQAIALPWILKFFPKSTRQILTVCMVICYMAYFYYQYAISQSFDGYFDRVGLLDYLKTLF